MGILDLFKKDTISEKPLDVLGASGVNISNWYIYEDSNYEWNWEKRKENIRAMINDEKISSCLSAYRSPLLRMQFDVVPVDDTESEMVKAEQVKNNLFEWMETTFSQFLSEATTSLEWGHSVFEKIFDRWEQGWYLKKMAFRKQSSIEKWTIGNDEAGITQVVSYPERGKTTFEIPMDKVMLLTHNPVGDNYVGNSILRPIYRMWKTKFNYWKFDNAIKEKYAGGIVKAFAPREISPEDKAEYYTMIAEMTATKRNGIVFPWTKEDGYDIEFMDLKIGDTKLLETIELIDNKMSEALLTSFIDSAGSGSAGSHARTESLVQFFMNSINSFANNFCSSFNKQVMEEYAYLNGWKQAPQLSFTPLSAKDNIGDIALVVERFVKSGVVTPTIDVENEMRERLGLEQITEEDKPEEVQEEFSLPTFSDTFEMPKLRTYARTDFATDLPRELTIFEKWVNVWWLQKFYEDAESTFTDEYKGITAFMATYILDKVKQAINKEDLSILKDMKLPKTNELKSLVTEISKESFEMGKTSASDEISEDVPRTSKDMNALYRIKTESQINTFESVIKAGVIGVTAGLIQSRAGTKNTSATEAISRVKKHLDTSITRQGQGMKTVIGQSVNAGRSFATDTYASKIGYAQYSAILDSQTTNRCISLDGRVVEYGSADYNNYTPWAHYNCRSIWVFIRNDSGEVEVAKESQNAIPSTIPKTTSLWEYQEMKDPAVLKDSLASNLLDEKNK